MNLKNLNVIEHHFSIDQNKPFYILFKVDAKLDVLYSETQFVHSVTGFTTTDKIKMEEYVRNLTENLERWKKLYELLTPKEFDKITNGLFSKFNLLNEENVDHFSIKELHNYELTDTVRKRNDQFSDVSYLAEHCINFVVTEDDIIILQD